jgi:hypothetical protein
LGSFFFSEGRGIKDLFFSRERKGLNMAPCLSQREKGSEIDPCLSNEGWGFKKDPSFNREEWGTTISRHSIRRICTRPRDILSLLYPST